MREAHCRTCGLPLLSHEQAGGICADCEIRAWADSALNARRAECPAEGVATSTRHQSTGLTLSGVFKRVSGKIKRGLRAVCRSLAGGARD